MAHDGDLRDLHNFVVITYSRVVPSDRAPGPFDVERKNSCRLKASAILQRRRHSSAVEQLFRKQQVLGSNPSVGSIDLNVKAGLPSGFLCVWWAVDSHSDSHATSGAG